MTDDSYDEYKKELERKRAVSEKSVYEWRQSQEARPFIPLSQRALESILRTQGRTHAGIVIPKFPHLTDALFGLRGVTLLTAPYGIGKTTLTLNIALEVARGGQCKVVYISSEMSAVRLVGRLLADMSKPVERGGGSALPMRRLLVGDNSLSDEQRRQAKLDGMPYLHSLQLENFKRAYAEFQELEKNKTLQIIDMQDIGSMRWSRGDGEHALTPLERKVDDLTKDAPEVLVILDTIAHLEVQPSGVGGDLADYSDDLSQDRDITAGLRAWREELGETRALLAVHEESKARTGSGDGHSIRGSSRYAYGADALIQLVYADSDKNTDGTVTLGLRPLNTSDEVTQIDAIINKARDGGTAGVTIALDHYWHEARIQEVGKFNRKDVLNIRRENKQTKAEKKKLDLPT